MRIFLSVCYREIKIEMERVAASTSVPEQSTIEYCTREQIANNFWREKKREKKRKKMKEMKGRKKTKKKDFFIQHLSFVKFFIRLYCSFLYAHTYVDGRYVYIACTLNAILFEMNE